VIVSNTGDGELRQDAGTDGLLATLPDVTDAGLYLMDELGRIVAVNPQAEKLLARRAGELLGRDAHDLLHRGSAGQPLPRSRCEILRAFLSGRTAQGDRGWFERGDGTLLPMCWLVTPCRLGADATGAMVLFHEAEPGRASRWAAEAEGSLTELDRLALLAETTTLLTSTLDVDEALRRLVGLVVPLLADWVVVDLIGETDEVQRAVVVHYENGSLVRRDDLEGTMPPVPQESTMPLSRALRGVASSLVTPRTYENSATDVSTAQREFFQTTGIHSGAIAPIHGLREVLGALTLGRAEREAPFAPVELSLLDDIARRAGLALGNARLYQRQRAVAETMQRHLLPRLPRVPGLEMTVRYVAAPHASHVGGDWYDAFTLSDGRAALAIGDVVGHDLDAAAGMAQVRNMLRAYAWSHQGHPGVIVDQLDQAVVHIAEAPMATLVFGVVERAEDGRWLLRWTNAGHPPPLLVTHEGTAHFLEDGQSLLLGSGITTTRTDALTHLPPLSTLVLYTDGLIESREHSLDEGLTNLHHHATTLATHPLDPFCNALLTRVRPPDNEDDVAMLALRVPGEG
jgi:serine phosphatase RsbU (regulator of sigma subunit)